MDTVRDSQYNAERRIESGIGEEAKERESVCVILNRSESVVDEVCEMTGDHSQLDEEDDRSIEREEMNDMAI